VSDVGAHEVVVDGRVPVQILSLEPLDAALLVFESSSWEPFPVDDRYLEEGERVSKSGWGAGLHWYTEGIATEDPGRVGMSVAPGDSGCPVFDSEGRVVAMVWARGWYSETHAFVVPVPDILSVLQVLGSL
jgi:hypothetical protein